MVRRTANKRQFSKLTLAEVMQTLGREQFTAWNIESPLRPPSEILKANLKRLNAFDQHSSEQAKTLLIDVLFAEIVSEYPRLKIWKSIALASDTLTGVADYLMTPHRAYLATPLLCVTEAKQDDFEQGQAQCVAEMIACQWNNRQSGLEIDIYGIVSNGQGWVFYKLTTVNEVFETELFAISDLSRLLGILDYICAECEKNVPPPPSLSSRTP